MNAEHAKTTPFRFTIHLRWFRYAAPSNAVNATLRAKEKDGLVKHTGDYGVGFIAV
jgi:hypothetical protein